MRDESLGQPAGGPLLQEVLGHAQYSLQNSRYNQPLYYKMSLGYVGEHGTLITGNGINKTTLHRPSYNLVMYYGKVPFFVAHYEFDKRFSAEMCEEEAERIEDYLANEVLGIIASNGLVFYIGARFGGALMSLLRKESDDKKFLPLN